MLRNEATDVLIGGYLSAAAAHEDYEAVLNCGARLLGAVVVTEDLEGNVAVEQTDHMVEEGAAGLASVGFVVGLFAPPLLAATAMGAALGAVGGEALHKRTGSKIEGTVGETIPIGGAGLIVAYHREVAEQVEPAVTRAVQRAVGEAEGSGSSACGCSVRRPATNSARTATSTCSSSSTGPDTGPARGRQARTRAAGAPRPGGRPPYRR
jgi:uncharacterized membrane protein